MKHYFLTLVVLFLMLSKIENIKAAERPSSANAKIINAGAYLFTVFGLIANIYMLAKCDDDCSDRSFSLKLYNLVALAILWIKITNDQTQNSIRQLENPNNPS